MPVLGTCVCICVYTCSLHLVFPGLTKWTFQRNQTIFSAPGGKTLKMARCGEQKPVEQS